MKINKGSVCLGVALVVSVVTLGARGGARSGAAQGNGAQESTVAPRVTDRIDETNRAVLRGNVHPRARAEFDRGPVADWQPMNRMLLLLQRSPAQEAELRQFLGEQQDKSSPNFQKWLTPNEFGKRFGPADGDIQAVTQWLVSQGFQNVKPGAGRVTIEFSGNVRQVRNAFHTEIHQFEVNGEIRQGNVADPEIPAALKPVVSGIVSLHNFPRKSFRHSRPFTRFADGRIVPQFTGASTSGSFYAVGPADFAKIYNIPSVNNVPSLTGSGGTIAIDAISDISLQDVASFQTLFGMTPKAPTIIVNGPDPGVTSEEGEADLDVEWSGAVAPGAVIDVVISEDTLTASGIDLSAIYVIDNNSADVLSLSFGDCELNLGNAGNAFYSSLWEQAGAQGITVTVSAGDAGSAGCDDFTTAKTAANGLAVSGIASTPFNIAVGGTDFDDAGTQTSFWSTANSTDGKRESALGYIHEIPWNDSCAAAATSSNLSTVCVNAAASLQNIVAGSGGPSNCSTQTSAGACTGGNSKPTWQSGPGVPADGVRDTPDVSLFASDGPTSASFYIVCQADAITAGSPPSCAPDSQGHFSFLATGGTSAAAPNFAGIMALIGQSESTAGRSRRQGNANFVLYKIAGTAGQSCNSSAEGLTGSTCSFNDTTKGTNAVPCAGNSPNCSSKTANTNGVLVDPAHTTNPAWMAGTGYDYATGLGTVNVTNLAAAWGTAVGGFKGTTTNLTVNGGTTQVTITHGTSVTAAVTVTPTTTGTPTGDVSLLAPTSVNGGIARSLLSAGAATITTSALPGGSYNLAAHYAGDGTFGASDSNGVPVVVNKEASRLQMGIVTFSLTNGAITSTNATTFAYGSPYILRFDILNSSGGSCQPLVAGGTTSGCAFDATGSVTVTDNGSPLDAGTFPINSAGHAEDQPIQLAAGTHNLSATYTGDISYSPPAAPTTSTLTVTKAVTTTTLSPIATSVVKGTSVTLTATVSSNSNSVNVPSGTVQFMNGSASLGTPATCTPVAATATAGASCTATLTTTLSQVVPLVEPPRPIPFPVWVPFGCCTLALVLFLLSIRYSEFLRASRLGLLSDQRLVYAIAGLALIAGLTAGIAGCGSNSHTDNITAVYGGDSNYAGSTSTAQVVTVR